MSKSGAFVLRVLTALVILPLIVFLIWAPRLEWAFTGAIALLAAIGLYEYYALVRRCAISPETIGGILAGTMVTLSGHAYRIELTALTLYGGCLLVSALHIVRGQRSVAGLATSVFGVAYVGWFAGHMILLHGIPGIGSGLVTVLIVAIALSDAGAYVTGTLFGAHKMAPIISPNKTWEGAAGGLIFTLAGTAVFYALSGRWAAFALPEWTLARYLYTGAILSVVGQIGDLAESCMKRSAGVKDSGAVFPGHGGVLDRGDGYLFAGPVLYYMVTLLFH